MKKMIKEQLSQTKIDLIQGRDTYKCPFLIGAQIGTSGGKQYMRRIASADSPKNNYVKGDSLFIKDDFTYDVVRDNKYVKQGVPWTCSTLPKDFVQPEINNQLKKDILDLVTFYKDENGVPLYKMDEPTSDQMAKGEYEKVNLKNETGFKDKVKFDYFIWKKTGLRQTQGPQQKNVIKTFTNAGWKDIGGKLDPSKESLYNTLDLHLDYPNEFPTSYVLVQPIESLDTSTVIQELNGLVKTRNFSSPKTCKKIIKNYSLAKTKKAPIDDGTLKNWKIAVNACDDKIKNFFDLNITNNILGKLREDPTNKYSLSYSPTKTVQQESKNNLIKNLIKENLIKTKENKKRMLIEEHKIVKNRLIIISENRVLKTKKQRDKFNNELLSEMIYFNKQNFNKQIINEQFWDVLKGIFGNGAGAIMDTFKEYIGSWLVDNLTPVDPDGWLGQLIITSVGNLDISEIGKLTNCDYLTKFLAKSISETMVRKLQTGADMRNPLFDVMRNAIVDTMEESSLGQRIEKGLVEIICPLLSGVKSKMDVATDKIKQGAISAAN